MLLCLYSFKASWWCHFDLPLASTLIVFVHEYINIIDFQNAPSMYNLRIFVLQTRELCRCSNIWSLSFQKRHHTIMSPCSPSHQLLVAAECLMLLPSQHCKYIPVLFGTSVVLHSWNHCPECTFHNVFVRSRGASINNSLHTHWFLTPVGHSLYLTGCVLIVDHL